MLRFPPLEPAPAAGPDAAGAGVPWTDVWSPELYDDPTAGPDADGAALGQRLAATLLATQGLYIFDHRAKQTLFVSAGVERLLGYPAACFTMAFHYGLIHPDDLPIVTEATVLVNRYAIEHRRECLADLVMAVDYRLRHAAGHWVRVLRQNFVLKRDPSGAVVVIGGLFTDITAHKHTHDVRFQVNRPDFADFVRRHRPATAVLSAREQEVLALMLDGHTSRRIAAQLCISPATVDTHRRNLRRKIQSTRLHHLLQHLDPA